MTTPADNPDGAMEGAVSALKGLGLTKYQARVYAGLTRIQRGTAREVADASGVPRARVYDTLNALHDHGIVDVQQSTPREYLAASPDLAIEALEARYRKHESAVRAALTNVEPAQPASATQQKGVWVVTDRDRVSTLERQFIAEATTRIIFGIASVESFDEETAVALETASEDVEIIVETITEEFVARFEVVPGIEVMTAESAWEDTPELEGRIGRILMVDDRHVLVSTVVTHDEGTGGGDESAVWTSGGGAGDGLVQALRKLMLDRVEGRIRDDGDAADE